MFRTSYRRVSPSSSAANGAKMETRAIRRRCFANEPFCSVLGAMTIMTRSISCRQMTVRQMWVRSGAERRTLWKERNGFKSINC